MTKKNNGYSYRLQIGPEHSHLSLLDFLSSKFSHSSKSEWNARIEDGEVFLNEQLAQADQQLVAGMVLVWNRPAWEEPDVPLSFEIAYQDRHMLIVDKPSGLPTLPGGGFLENTLLHQVQNEYPAAKPMHRLGRGTSGLVLFALSGEAASRIGQNWSSIKKQYSAVACHTALKQEYDIRTKIGMVDHPRLGKVHAACEAGKDSRSIARVVRSLNCKGRDCTLFEVDLLTGRPHQIRIHLASIHHPLLGDPMYDNGGSLLPDPGLPSDLGYQLHAGQLLFQHPVDATPMKITSEPPAGFALSDA